MDSHNEVSVLCTYAGSSVFYSFIERIGISTGYQDHLRCLLLSAEQGCSPKKKWGGRLKQDLDKDLQLRRILFLLY